MNNSIYCKRQTIDFHVKFVIDKVIIKLINLSYYAVACGSCITTFATFGPPLSTSSHNHRQFILRRELPGNKSS